MDRIAQDDGLERGVGQRDILRRVDLGLTTSLEPPSCEEELKLANIWQAVLGIDVIGVADDFFELGGDSFAATALAAEIEAIFDVRFAPSDIINCSTIAKQAQAVASSLHGPRRLPPHVIVGRAEGSKPPLFSVHGAAGFSFFNRAFLDVVGQDRPIYLFQAPGLDGRTAPLQTVEEIASAYVASMREIQSAGPYHISAMCAGSFVALEMCNQLTEAGQAVARLILLDPRSVPPALARRYKESRGKTLSFKSIYKGLRRLSQAWRGDPDEFEKKLEARARTLKRRQQIQVRRAAGSLHDEKAGIAHSPLERIGNLDASPYEKSYSPDTMLEASLQLYDALTIHVPRPFAGKATLITSSKSLREFIGDKSFWRDHLGSLEYRVVDGNHRKLFGANILETASFVRSALDAPS
jgi:thioesterase domain-containing protein/acyl carrier protein